jgi:plastocyanin
MLRRGAIPLLVVAPLLCAATLDVAVVDQSGAPVSDAVVYATQVVGPPARPSSPGMIVQREKTFIPTVTPIQSGTAIAFPNEDTVRHHVYSFSPAKVFELKLYIGSPREPVLFDKAGVVVLGCNIHDHMLAYVVVVDTPYFAKTDASGAARLASLPDGEYQLRVWHARLPGATLLPSAKFDVRLPASGATTVEVALGPAGAHPGAHKR